MYTSKIGFKMKSKHKQSNVNLGDRVVQFLRNQHGAAIKQKRIAKALDIRPGDYTEFKHILKELADQGKIERRRNSYLVPQPKRLVQGQISFANGGFAFVTPVDGSEIYIPEGCTGTALPGDRVEVEVLSQKSGPRTEGIVRQVLHRSNTTLMGMVKKQNGRLMVSLKQSGPLVNFFLTDIPTGLRAQQLVLITDIEWTNPREVPRCRIKSILGTPTNPADDFTILLKMYNLSQTFPPKVLKEVEAILPEWQIEKRLDLQAEEIFTIDPITAKDYDDAVSLKILEDGNWYLGVHIADVSHYVPPASAIDKEARRRGTSIYCGNEVIPMLPPQLSEDLCSLQPGKAKLTVSVLMTIAPNGSVLKVEFQPSIINSKRRFTYEEVQGILDRCSGPHVATLLAMRELSQILYQLRLAQGSVDFDLPEPLFDLDENGIPTKMLISQRLPSHQIIEEFMLLANHCVAEYIALKRRRERLPFLYRVHPRPTEEDIDSFYATLQRLGLSYQRPRSFTPKQLQTILFEIQDLPCKNYIEQLALRSMTKAIYAAQPLGHFGLAFRYYTHFTSPIRRYPDLIVHRLLKEYLQAESSLKLDYYRRVLPRIARQANENELLAMEVEREFIKIKQIRFLEKRVGNWYEGPITGVAEYGFFVEISQYLVEGLVHIRTLLDDYYEYNPQDHILRGRRFGRVFRLGDRVKVKLKAVSLQERRIDLEWGE
jgi:ribonuclease R